VGLIANDDISLRPTGAADAPFLLNLFKTVRAEQFAGVDLAPAMLDALLEQQFRIQAASYATQFPDAKSFVIEQAEQPVGRLTLHCDAARQHIVDIALLATFRARGIGTSVVATIEADAREQGVPALTLVVLATNEAARRFYLRQGFVEVGQAGPTHIAMRKDLA
jgi:ribosomal protein S18 acetylase RimI-like enzyme